MTNELSPEPRRGSSRPEQDYQLDLWRASADALLIVQEATVVAANPAAAELFGYGEHEFEGTQIEELVPSHLDEDHRRMRRDFQRGRAHRPMHGSKIFDAVAADGSLLQLYIGLVPLDEDRRRTLVIGREASGVLSSGDHVTGPERETLIQQLFAAGLELRQGGDGENTPHINRALSTLDQLIATLVAGQQQELAAQRAAAPAPDGDPPAERPTDP